MPETLSIVKPTDLVLRNITDVSDAGEAIAKVGTPATAKLLQVNADGTASLVDPPTGGTGGGETPTATASDLYAYGA